MDCRKVFCVRQGIRQYSGCQHGHSFRICNPGGHLCHGNSKRSQASEAFENDHSFFRRTHVSKLMLCSSGYFNAKQLLQSRMSHRTTDIQTATTIYVGFNLVHFLITDCCHMRQNHHIGILGIDILCSDDFERNVIFTHNGCCCHRSVQIKIRMNFLLHHILTIFIRIIFCMCCKPDRSIVMEIPGHILLIGARLSINPLHQSMINLRNNRAIRIDRIHKQECTIMYQCRNDMKHQLFFGLRRGMICKLRITS